MKLKFNEKEIKNDILKTRTVESVEKLADSDSGNFSVFGRDSRLTNILVFLMIKIM